MNGWHGMFGSLAAAALCLAAVGCRSCFPGRTPGPIVCGGAYRGHLQGVDTDGTNIWWSFTSQLVRTDLEGTVLACVSAPSHQGDLCVRGGRLYVAVNRGRFNQPAAAISEVRSYDAHTLALERTWTLDMPHGAGGMTEKDGHFYVVGGLPATCEVNYVYEYDGAFNLVRRHELPTGFTLMGIQTATVIDGEFRFGIYGAVGDPAGVLACPADLSGFTRYLGAGNMGILELNGVVYTARALDDAQKGDASASRSKRRSHRAQLVPDFGFCQPERKYEPIRRNRGCVRVFYEADGTDGWADAGYELKPDGYRPLFCPGKLSVFMPHAAAGDGRSVVPAVGIGGRRRYSAPDLVRAVRRCAEKDETMALHVPGSAKDVPQDVKCAAALEAVRAECDRLGVRFQTENSASVHNRETP